MICKIHQRGRNYYYCGREPEFIQRDPNDIGKKLWLSEDAKETVTAAMEEYERGIEAIKKEYIRVPVKLSEELELIVLYKHKAGNKYDFVNEIYLKGAVPSHKASWGQSLRGMLHSLRFFHLDSGLRGEHDRDKEYDMIFDALYLSAVERGDELMQLEMKLLNNTADREECKRLSELLGEYIIPPISEIIGTDKDGDLIAKEYTVIAETIDRDMLDRSGYNIWHRPYFAMPGSTHENWTIVPTNRYVLDAAKKDKEAISFQEFLKLFDEDNKDGE
ncbi:MAG: hypothetical protein IKN17_10290 [Ruminococcus sp.]|nr:hypothetical protein [Ruminococcus sp.]